MPLFGPPEVGKLKNKGDIDGLIKALEYKNEPNVRSAAAKALGEISDERAVEPLIAALKDKKAVVRQNAAMALGKIEDSRAVEPLAAALQDENFTVSTVAATALGEIGDERAVEPLTAALDDESSFLRNAAAKALKQFVGAYEAKTRLDASEKAKTTPEERIGNGIKILEDLCSGMGGEDQEVYVQRAVEVLEPEGAEGSRALVGLIADLLACRSSKLKVILDVAQQLEPSPELVDAVLEVKGASELAPVPANYKYTAEIVGDGKVGWTTGTAGDIQRKTILVLEKLTGAVVEPAGMVRPGADLAGGDFEEADWDSADLTGANLKGANLEDAILRHAKLVRVNLEGANLKGANLYFANLTGANLRGADLRDANLYMSVLTDAELEGADVTGAYVEGAVTLPSGHRGGISDLKQFTLGESQESEELETTGDVMDLLKALEKLDPAIHEPAIEALAELGVAAIEPLIATFEGENLDARRHAGTALGKIGSAAIEPLLAALKDESVDLRYNAAEALGQIGDEIAVEPLSIALDDKDGLVRGSASWALGELGSAGVEPLISALKNKPAHIRRMVCDDLARTGDKRAVEPLIHTLQHDEDVIARKNAAQALAKLGDERAAEPLRKAMEDEDEEVRKAAVRALEKLG